MKFIQYTLYLEESSLDLWDRINFAKLFLSQNQSTFMLHNYCNKRCSGDRVMTVQPSHFVLSTCRELSSTSLFTPTFWYMKVRSLFGIPQWWADALNSCQATKQKLTFSGEQERISLAFVSVRVACLFTHQNSDSNFRNLIPTCDIWGSHGGEDVSVVLLDCDFVWIRIFGPEDGGSMFLRNFDVYQWVHPSSKPRRPASTFVSTFSNFL
jgi:hypothetical protein